MFCKLLVLNFLNLLLNPQHFIFRKGRFVSMAQDKRKSLAQGCVIIVCLEQAEPGESQAVSVKTGNFNNKSKNLSTFLISSSSPQGMEQFKT